MAANKELIQILENNFGLNINLNQLDTESEYFKQLQILLSQRVVLLINTNVEKLFQILYKVDVPQVEIDKAFDLGEVNKIAMQISEGIIRRQLKKIDYAREFYKKQDE